MFGFPYESTKQNLKCFIVGIKSIVIFSSAQMFILENQIFLNYERNATPK